MRMILIMSKQQQMELRTNNVEVRAAEDGSLFVSGYVNETGKLSEILGGSKRFREKISKGAFQKAIDKAQERGIDFLAEHDREKILSSTRNQSLKLKEDSKGLYMEATITPTSFGRDYYELIKSNLLSSMSFGFRAVKDNWKNAASGLAERTVEELELFEVSVVRDPAYSASNIQARGINLVNEQRAEKETVEVSVEDLNSILAKAQEMKEQYEALKEDIQALQKQLKNSENSDNEENQRSIEDELVYRRILNLKGEIH